MPVWEPLMAGDLKQQRQEKEVDFRVKAVFGSSGLETTSAFPFLCPPGCCPLQTVCKPGVVLRASGLFWKLTCTGPGFTTVFS